MKHLYLFVLLIISFSLIQAQNVNIPDSNFKDYLVNNICADLNNDGFVESDVDTNNDGEIQVSEAEAVFRLEIDQNCLATSLEGIEAFININEFSLDNTLVNDLSLNFLTQIDEIEILDNSNLSFIDFSSINSINNSISIEGNPILESMNVSNVTSLGNLFFESNSDALTNQFDLDFPNLQTMGILFISDVVPSNPINIFFPALQTITGSSHIQNSNIGTVNMINLTTTQGFEFKNNTTVSELNLENLTYNFGTGTGGEIIINGVDLTSLNLSNLISTTDRMIIQGNVDQFVVDLSNLETVADDLNLFCACPLVSLPNLQSVNRIILSGQEITQIDLSALVTGDVTMGSNSGNLTDIDLSSLVESSILITNNLITELNLPNLVILDDLNLDNNLLQSINMPLLESANSIRLFNNQFTNLQFSDVTISNLNVDSNPLTNLQLINSTINGLSFNNNDMSSLDLSTVIFEQVYIANNSSLSDINFKNGQFNDTVGIVNTPNLQYICGDTNEIDFLSNLGIENCQINTYCSFVPGGEFYSLSGEITFDSNSNGCDISDENFPNAMMSITDGVVEGIVSTDSNGFFFIPLQEGNYSISPILQNSD
ncbi:MAG: hypothetical protein HRU26_13115, partial [Psychroserpens sp.]|nr:hypothetical protein [Psychroserpens sp.]